VGLGLETQNAETETRSETLNLETETRPRRYKIFRDETETRPWMRLETSRDRDVSVSSPSLRVLRPTGPKSIRCTCDGSQHGEARRVRKGERWSAHLGWGHDVRAATDLSAQGKGGMGLAADPRSVPFACNLCYTPRQWRI
jgi:hypothetical protein